MHRYLDMVHWKYVQGREGLLGTDILNATQQAKDVTVVRTNIVGSILRNGSIMVVFDQKGKGKISYSHQQHTHTKMR